MAKKITAWLAFAAFLVCSAGSALSMDKKLYLGANGLLTLQELDEDQTKEKFTGPINVDFDDSWGAQLRAGYVVNNIFTVEALFEYIALLRP